MSIKKELQSLVEKFNASKVNLVGFLVGLEESNPYDVSTPMYGQYATTISEAIRDYKMGDTNVFSNDPAKNFIRFIQETKDDGSTSSLAKMGRDYEAKLKAFNENPNDKTLAALNDVEGALSISPLTKLPKAEENKNLYTEEDEEETPDGSGPKKANEGDVKATTYKVDDKITFTYKGKDYPGTVVDVIDDSIVDEGDVIVVMLDKPLSIPKPHNQGAPRTGYTDIVKSFEVDGEDEVFNLKFLKKAGKTNEKKTPAPIVGGEHNKAGHGEHDGIRFKIYHDKRVGYWAADSSDKDLKITREYKKSFEEAREEGVNQIKHYLDSIMDKAGSDDNDDRSIDSSEGKGKMPTKEEIEAMSDEKLKKLRIKGTFNGDPGEFYSFRISKGGMDNHVIAEFRYDELTPGGMGRGSQANRISMSSVKFTKMVNERKTRSIDFQHIIQDVWDDKAVKETYKELVGKPSNDYEDMRDVLQAYFESDAPKSEIKTYFGAIMEEKDGVTNVMDDKTKFGNITTDGWDDKALLPLFESMMEVPAKCIACSHNFDYALVNEVGMGYVKCPKCGEPVTQSACESKIPDLDKLKYKMWGDDKVYSISDIFPTRGRAADDKDIKKFFAIKLGKPSYDKVKLDDRVKEFHALP